jgi:hypothetical protein
MGRRRNISTIDDYQRALKNGYGVGEGKNYSPWFRIQDKKSKPNDKSGKRRINGLTTGRQHHTMSLLEAQFFYLVDFSESVIDIREQFPLIPLNVSQNIASSYDIPYPLNSTSNQPDLITTTFLLTRTIDDNISYEAVTVLPSLNKLTNVVSEKLDLERLWWSLLDVKFSCFTGNERTRCQAKNIAWITNPLRSGIINFTDIEVDIAVGLLSNRRYFLKEICELYIDVIKIDHDNALNLLLVIISKKYITIDLNYLIQEVGYIEIISIRDQKQDAIHAY